MARRPRKSAVSPGLVEQVVAALDDDKARDVVVIDLAGKASFADHMVVATGTSQRHVAAIAAHLRESLKGWGIKSPSVEGQARGDWVLVDAGDVVIHIFRAEVRAFYDLEQMWAAFAAEPVATKPAAKPRRSSASA
ncbi:MAG: ribosome silencing factor [Rhodospirillales bacterium]|nr:ribosome silencing factor [Rhodospirillales bacterium]